MKESEHSNNSSIVWALLLVIPIIIAIVYLKMEADDSSAEKTEVAEKSQLPIAVPDTTFAADAFPIVSDSANSSVNESVGLDTRTAIEAGDEDGYWDGWYDGVETGERTRYDERSNFTTLKDKEAYANSYREGYEKGFAESVQQKNN